MFRKYKEFVDKRDSNRITVSLKEKNLHFTRPKTPNEEANLNYVERKMKRDFTTQV